MFLAYIMGLSLSQKKWTIVGFPFKISKESFRILINIELAGKGQDGEEKEKASFELIKKDSI